MIKIFKLSEWLKALDLSCDVLENTNNFWSIGSSKGTSSEQFLYGHPLFDLFVTITFVKMLKKKF